MDRGSYNGRGGGNRGRDRGRVRGYNEQRQGRARGYNEPRQDRARAYYEQDQVRARGQHEQEQGRGRSGRDGFQMSSSSSNQPRPSGQHQFTETGAPENQPVSQTPEATVISWADRLRRGVGTASPRPQQQQGRDVTSTVWARPQLQQGRGGGVGQQHGGGNQQQEGVDRPPLRSSDASVLLGKINLKDSKKREPMGRPDGGNNSDKSISLHANHFPVKFKDGTIILHYDVDVQQVDENQPGKPVTEMFDLRKIREKWLVDKPAEFPCDKTAYDGNKNIFSAVDLPAKPLTVNCSVGDDAKECKYTLTFKLVAQLQLDNVTGYVKRNLQNIPRDVLQGMDLVMKENPRRCRISVGRCFYSNNAYKNLNCGVVARKGFQQSLKLTSEGLALCLDYSELLVIPEQISVIGFLEKYYGGRIEDIFKYRRAAASDLLTGLKVKVTHRPIKQKFVIKKLTPGETRALKFRLQDTEVEVFVVDYFNEKYTRKIRYKHFPSLDIGKGVKENYVPVEFCELVAGQRFPKDRLKTASPKPEERRKLICETVLATDGPRTTIPGNFKIRVDDHMTRISGCILPVPVLKLGGQIPPYLNDKTCQWNLVGKSVVEGKALQRWALIDFSSKESRDLLKLQVDKFVLNLRDRCRELSINMEEPAVVHSTDMKELSAVGKVENLLKVVVDAADQKIKGKLQMIVCVMTSKHNGYKYLKWVSETKIGIVTQCCLSSNANKLHNQYLPNLCMKINAKLGGSNMELMERLPNFGSDDNVMFIGADVNHPAAGNVKCPSIAAVVATINWPAANKYAARVSPQEHRTEKIIEFGKMCKDLVRTYAELNSVKPNKIVVFRDGVSESQFDMVLNEELNDLVEAIYESNKYQPAITLVVAQKRHHTRLFPMDGNVSPGTVVDTQIVHPSGFDFYLCSHYGQLGTSKATHYHVLFDENGFKSVDLQRLIYNMCFTFARCTKPVSLVPPVYYADLVAYRGRMFQEVLKEMSSSRSTTSSSEASSSSSSPIDSFAQGFYDLHRDLQNTMFFV
ncbi:hypothetical protein AABB24_003258 [Solanum stoloniferum]|uniref:Protein argonaute 2-like n=2 Tax=Solanum TaxID=4107 RepID=A0AAF0Q5Y0_SOLVR|nr:hypothetical protein MTR67_008790 [Solanum verrucosum]